MIFIGAAGAISVILFAISKWIEDYEPFICGTMASMFIAILLTCILSVCPNQREVGFAEIPIVALKEYDSSYISGGGSFIGFSVSGGSEMQYVIMEDTQNGMLRSFLDQDETYIVETDDPPYVRYPQFEGYYSKWFTFWWKWDDVETYFLRRHATVYIPKGTVISKFDPI